MSKSDSPTAAKLLAYLQLARIPNVFTALADVSMGFLVMRQSLEPVAAFLFLAIASGCLYTAGMVLNDVYDYDVDLAERPGRPLPSGRISVNHARTLGYTLLLSGVVLGGLAGAAAGEATDVWWRSGVIATALAACVVFYDGLLKKTWAGPLAMGACRFFNVLLGMSVGIGGERIVGPMWFGLGLPHLLIAAGIGTYIVGVTWFARTEASHSQRGLLTWGMTLMAAGAVFLGALPYATEDARSFRVEPFAVWPTLLCLLMLPVLSRCLSAVLDPQPRKVQLAVKRCILSLIFLDAAVVLLIAPSLFAVGVLALYLPTLLLGKWVYST